MTTPSFDGNEEFGNEDDEGLGGPPRKPATLLRKIEEAVHSYTNQNLDAALPGAFDMAAPLCVALGDVARVRVFYQRAERAWSVMEGDDSPNTVMNRLRSQEPLEVAAVISNDCETSIEDVPKRLDAAGFEAWL